MENTTTFPPAQWRLLITPPAEGAWNMAVDEAILQTIHTGDSLPTLRLYAWKPPCLSLGYAQPYADADLPRLQQRGWDIVRRPTGGRAILHTDELTYAVIAPHSEPRLAGSLLECYHRLSLALLAALQRLGLPVIASPTSPSRPGSQHGAVCFETPSNYEITFSGKKLVGSAQARRKDGILQHGSLPLSGDLTRITQVLAFPDEDHRMAAAARLLSRAITAGEALGKPATWQDAAQAFIAAFQSVLSLELIPSPLTPRELSRITTLVNEKYAHPSWAQRV